LGGGRRHPNVNRSSRISRPRLLASDQEALSSRFAAAGNEDVRFGGLACSTGRTGAPRLPGALAALDCRTVSLHDAGDHVICVGEVMDANVSALGAPLVYYEGGYRTLERPRAEARRTSSSTRTPRASRLRD
jgi:flavin reductase (DIM6/NTAB) family NADH-FMN oxidoreductase RutF